MTMATPKQVGRRIALWRGEQGITQSAFALELGITQSALSKLERGLVYPSSPTLVLLRWKMGTTIDALLDREP